jgi:hypothetical protein
MIEDKIRVQVIFTEDTKYGKFTDALYYPIEEYSILGAKTLTDAKQARVDNWIYIIEHPVSVVTSTLTDYIEERRLLVFRIEQLTDKINELGTVKDLEIIRDEYSARLSIIEEKITLKSEPKVGQLLE